MDIDPARLAWNLAANFPNPDASEASGDSAIGTPDAVCIATKLLLNDAQHEVKTLYACAANDNCEAFLVKKTELSKRTPAIERLVQCLRGKWSRANLKTAGVDTCWHNHHYSSAHLSLFAWRRAQLFMIMAVADTAKLLRAVSGEPEDFTDDDVRDRWEAIRTALPDFWEDPGQLYSMVEAERDAVLEIMGGTVLPSTQTPSLDSNDIAVLVVLSNRLGTLLDNHVLEAITEISRKTVGKSVAKLIKCGYANRPNGPRKGCAITDAGFAFAERLSN